LDRYFRRSGRRHFRCYAASREDAVGLAAAPDHSASARPLGAFALNATQADRERKREDRRAALDRAIAEDRAREDTLRAYLQQMSDLITKQGLRSEESRGTANDDVGTLARTLTLTVLRRLDSDRKALVLQFLLEARLITAKREFTPGGRDQAFTPGGRARVLIGPSGGAEPRVALYGADLRGVVLRTLPLVSSITTRSTGQVTVAAALDGTDLRQADFRGADLTGVSLAHTDLRNADFRSAYLNGTSFRSSCLSGARFGRASVSRPGGALFAISSAPKSALFVNTRGRNVDFSGAELNRADFTGAQLTDINLQGATTRAVAWPKGWTFTGLRMREAQARDLCRSERRR
jgi:uncharacterized protein YjbI with pentapeptide repeats